MWTKKLQTILLVEDDPITNYVNERLIKTLGIAENILVMSNGENAFQFLKDCADHRLSFPDLILLDINMPVSNGFHFLERLKKLDFANEHMIIAVLTTSNNLNDMHRIAELGVGHFIQKPLTAEKLFKLIPSETRGLVL